MPASLHARDIGLSLGTRHILDQVDIDIDPGHRIGLVGPNGVGKSTLLRVLAGALRPERGTLRASPPDATIGYLAQEPERTAETVAEHLVRRTGVGEASDALDRATQALADGEPGADDRYAAALERWLALGAADVDSRMADVWADLGLGREPARPADDHAVGRRGGTRRARRAPPRPVRHLPARRADQRSRPRRAGPPGALRHRARRRRRARQPRPHVPRADDHRRRRARRVQPQRHPLRRRVVGLPARARRRPRPGVGGVRDVRHQALDARLARPARARVGVAGPVPGEEEADGQRQVRAQLEDQPDRAAGRQGGAHGEGDGAPRRGRAAARGVAAAADDGRRRAQRRRGRPAARRGGRPRRLRARAGRPARSATASGW